MKIFDGYTGNALLNSALYTIEALAGLERVSDLTTRILERLFLERDLAEINLRLKSYTMVFSKNGPLLNDAQFGRKIYRNLILDIIRNCESGGDKICEISGLRFQTSFSDYYKKVLKELGYPEGKKKDTTISRVWFPLCGSLGSDAQALPQAKFAVNIHPVCLVLMQFLPLSAVLYKGGVLLVDSINFQFARAFVASNVKTVAERIEMTPGNESVENIRDYKLSHYLLKAISLWQEKKLDYEDNADLNLWSFSNSGTGASCEIHRIPNKLLRNLRELLVDPKTEIELKSILTNSDCGNSFIYSLDKEEDWKLLYPAKKYDGVSLAFFEKYQTLTGNRDKLLYARYIAALMCSMTYNKTDSKLLEKTDAYTDIDYKIIVLQTLVQAAEQGKWSIDNHLKILDRPDDLPVNAGFWGLLKKVHYYYQWYRKTKETPALEKIVEKPEDTMARRILGKFISLIDNDNKRGTVIKNILEPRENTSVRFDDMLARVDDDDFLELDSIVPIFYNAEWEYRTFGLIELLRVYYSQKDGLDFISNPELGIQPDMEFGCLKMFCGDYIDYYKNKYGNQESGNYPVLKLKKHVLDMFPENGTQFNLWLMEAVENVNDFLATREKTAWWDEEELLHNRDGEICTALVRFAIRYELKMKYINLIKNN